MNHSRIQVDLLYKKENIIIVIVVGYVELREKSYLKKKKNFKGIIRTIVQTID